MRVVVTYFSPAILALVTMIFTGCGKNKQTKGESGQDIAKVDVTILTELSEEQKKQKEQGMAAKKQLFEALVKALTNSMTENGVAKSIVVCKEVAPKLAEKVSSETKIKIGRTSFKLRNNKNQPPAWAAQFVHDKTDKELTVQLDDNKLGILSPIRLKEACTLCHGTKEQVTPNVNAALLANYPDDQATGFSVGDVRGYFWMEIPELQSEN